MIVIGSRAAKFFFRSYYREPNDWDIIASQQEINDFLNKHKEKIVYSYPSSPYKMQVRFNDGTKIEFELDTVPSNTQLIQCMNKNYYYPMGFIDFYGEALSACPTVFLMLMKRALLYWPVHWDKSIDDYHFLRNSINPLEYPETDRCERSFPNFIKESEKKFFDLRLKENDVLW